MTGRLIKPSLPFDSLDRKLRSQHPKSHQRFATGQQNLLVSHKYTLLAREILLSLPTRTHLSVEDEGWQQNCPPMARYHQRNTTMTQRCLRKLTRLRAGSTTATIPRLLHQLKVQQHHRRRGPKSHRQCRSVGGSRERVMSAGGRRSSATGSSRVHIARFTAMVSHILQYAHTCIMAGDITC